MKYVLGSAMLITNAISSYVVDDPHTLHWLAVLGWLTALVFSFTGGYDVYPKHKP